MTTVRILVLAGALALVAFTAKLALTGGGAERRAAASAPRQQLDNVREKARQIELDQQRAADRPDAER